MALYVGEEQVWKCPRHPSKRRRSGICPTCLRERLATLCPDCANLRPCGCCTTSSSSSSSSSFSFFSSLSSSSYSAAPAVDDCAGSTGLVSNLIESEPKFRRSRSVAIPFVKSRFGASGKEEISSNPVSENKSTKASVFLSFFKSKKSSKGEEKLVIGHEEWKGIEIKKLNEEEDERSWHYNNKICDFEKMMMRTRSVSASMSLAPGGGDVRSSAKGKGWHFPSPIKIFRQRSKVVQDRSPLHRG